jgi:iron(II)-dependent oxidoreductase
VELKADVQGKQATLSFPMEAHGYGAVLASSGAVPGLDRLLPEMARLAKTSLKSLPKERPVLNQRMVPIAPAPKSSAPSAEMLRVPAATFDFQVSGIMIEGGNEVGVDLQYAWEDSPRRHHSRTIQLPAFYIDRYPVTNAQFRKFLDATHYQPRDDHNCLPHEWEWQRAAQGDDHRLYPWGDHWDAKAVPAPDTGHTMAAPADVSAHPAGASPFGVEDLVGNVWQWTDEWLDEHTRAAILRGGSHYQPQGSHWYFPQAYKLNEHGKYLLMAPAKDRSGAVGFRCAADLQ